MNIKPVRNFILGILLGLAIFYLMNRFFPSAEKNYNKVTISTGTIKRDTLNESVYRFKGDTVSAYKTD